MLKIAPLAALFAAALALAIGFAQAAAPAGVTAGSPGDLTCNHIVNPDDSLVLATHLSGLTFATHPGCPDVGDVSGYRNGRIAFSDEDGEIYVMDADGHNLTNITNSPGVNDEYPSWSPDGSRILFDSNASGEGQLYTMNPNGTDVQRLTNSTVRDVDGHYSPDGQAIVFTAYDPVQSLNDVYTIDANGGNRTNITGDNPGDDFGADWSPDGTRLAFSSDRHGNYVDLYTMDPDGQNATPLVLDLGYSANPSWSPDGSRILFSNSDPDIDIWVVSAAGGQPVNISNAPGRDTAPSWSPDGTAILFASERLDADPDNCQPCRWELFRMDANGDNPTLVLDRPGEQYDPEWQPLPRLFGDLNCDDLVNGADLIVSLRDNAGLPLDLPAGCAGPS